MLAVQKEHKEQREISLQRNLTGYDSVGKDGVYSAVLNVSVACFAKFVRLPKNLPKMSTA